MAEAVKSITASTYSATTGLGIRYIGNHCYAYAGAVVANNNTVTCLSFTTGSGYVVAEFSQALNYSNVGNGKLIGFTIELNGIIICDNLEATQTFGTNENNQPSTFNFIIPPFTQVKTEATTDGAADIPFYHSITGRVYGVE